MTMPAALGAVRNSGKSFDSLITLLPNFHVKSKDKGFPYSIPSVGPGADPGVQAVSLQVTVSHPPGGIGCHYFPPGRQLPPQPQSITVHRPLAGTKLYCLVTEAHRCKQLA